MTAPHSIKYVEAEDIAKIRKSGIKTIAGVRVEDLLQAVEGSREMAEIMWRDIAELRRLSEAFETASQLKMLRIYCDGITKENEELRQQVKRLKGRKP